MSRPARRRVERNWSIYSASVKHSTATREAVNSRWLDAFLEPPELPTVERKGDLLRTLSHGLAGELEHHETLLLLVVGMAIRDAAATKVACGPSATRPTARERDDAREFLQGRRFDAWCHRFDADPEALRRALIRCSWWPAEALGEDADP